MKPDWRSDCGRVTTLYGDCLERMGELEDGSIDLILCDLPYGTTACKWDTIIPFEPLWAHYKRVIKPNGAIVLTASQPFTSALVMSNPKWFRYEWIWEKSVGTGFLDANRKPLKCHESVLIFAYSRPLYHPQKTPAPRKVTKRTSNAPHYGDHGKITTDNKGEAYPRSVVYCPATRKTLHRTQKPVALMEYMVRTYTTEGETVMDNCYGSGTTGVACANTGRRFVGIEMDADYYRIGRERIEAALAESPLFVESAA